MGRNICRGSAIFCNKKKSTNSVTRAMIHRGAVMLSLSPNCLDERMLLDESIIALVLKQNKKQNWDKLNVKSY